MRAVKFEGHRNIAIVETSPPEPDDQSVLIRVRASAICGSEMHCFRGNRSLMQDNLNCGHEVVGEIQWAPPGTGLAVGTRVGARVVQGCGTCDWCQQGEETACENKRIDGANGHSDCFKLGLQGVEILPDDVDWPQAALLSGDGMGVPVRAAGRLGNTRGKKILILGLGPIGLSCALVQNWRGAQVMGADISTYRLNLASELGAQQTVNVAHENLKERVMAWTDKKGADIVILAVARQESLTQAYECVRRHGTVMLIAGIEEATMDFGACFVFKEVTMMGSWYYTSSDWEVMKAWHKKGLPYPKLITHVMPVEQAQEAYNLFDAGESGKIVLTY